VEETVVAMVVVDRVQVLEDQGEAMIARTRAVHRAEAGVSSKIENRGRTLDIITVKVTLETHSMKIDSRGDGHGR